MARRPTAVVVQVLGQLSHGHADSRSQHCLYHLVCKPVEALQLGQAIKCAALFNPIAQELAQDLDLLPGEISGGKRGDDSDQVRHRSRADFLVCIVDIFA